MVEGRLIIRSMLCLIVFLSGCQPGLLSPDAPADTQPGEVAFKFTGPGEAAIVVPVRINQQGPFNFVLDTGATLTCLDEELARKLALPEKRGQVGVGAGVGGAGQVRLIGVDSLEVGTASARDLTACAIDLQQLRALGGEIQGLVGLNFLKSYRVTLDFERSTLKLEKPQE